MHSGFRVKLGMFVCGSLLRHRKLQINSASCIDVGSKVCSKDRMGYSWASMKLHDKIKKITVILWAKQTFMQGRHNFFEG